MSSPPGIRVVLKRQEHAALRICEAVAHLEMTVLLILHRMKHPTNEYLMK